MIIWVASYPKSGNTWVRSIISSLVYTEDGIFNFPSIKKIDQYPQRRFLEYFTQDYNNIHEIKKHWIIMTRLNVNIGLFLALVVVDPEVVVLGLDVMRLVFLHVSLNLALLQFIISSLLPLVKILMLKNILSMIKMELLFLLLAH